MIGFAIFLTVGAVVILKVGGWVIDCMAANEATDDDLIVVAALEIERMRNGQ